MEIGRILKLRDWSVVSTARVIGAFVGPILTLGTFWLAREATPGDNPFHPLIAISALFLWPADVLCDQLGYDLYLSSLFLWPADVLCDQLGYDLYLSSNQQVAADGFIPVLCLAAAINSVFYSLVGGIVGYAILGWRSTRNENMRECDCERANPQVGRVNLGFRRLLSWRAWKLVRKAQAVGAAVGALVTVAALPLAPVMEVSDKLFYLKDLLFYPTWLLCELFREAVSLAEKQWLNPGWVELAYPPLWLIATVNACLFFFPATIVGYSILGWRARKAKNQQD